MPIEWGLLTQGLNGPTQYEQSQARDMQEKLAQQQLAQSQQATQLGAAQLQKMIAADQRMQQFTQKMQTMGASTDWRQTYQALIESGDPANISHALQMRKDAEDAAEYQAYASKNLANPAAEPAATATSTPASAPAPAVAPAPAPAPAATEAMPASTWERYKEQFGALGDLTEPDKEPLRKFINNAYERSIAQPNNLAAAVAPAAAPTANNLGKTEVVLPPVTVIDKPLRGRLDLNEALYASGSKNARIAKLAQNTIDVFKSNPELIKLLEHQSYLRSMGAQPNDPEMKVIQAHIDKINSHAPAASTTVNVGQEKAFNQALGKGQGEKLMASKQAAEDARDILDTVSSARGIMKSGMITGTGADFLVNFNQALKTIGVDAGYADAAANSQAYTATMAQNVGKLIKQFGAGTGLSDADRAYAEKMAGGNITLDKKAIEKILEINERAANNVIKRHNKSVQGVETNIPLTVELPTVAKPTAGPKTPIATAQDKAALDWANANPNDPRAAQIKSRLGQ